MDGASIIKLYQLLKKQDIPYTTESLVNDFQNLKQKKILQEILLRDPEFDTIPFVIVKGEESGVKFDLEKTSPNIKKLIAAFIHNVNHYKSKPN